MKDTQPGTENHGTRVPNRELTDYEIEIIAKRAAELAAPKAAEYAMDTLLPEGVFNLVMEHVYREVGKGVIRKGLWAVGIAVTAFTSAVVAWVKMK